MLIQVLHKPKAIVIYMYLYPKKAVPVLKLLSEAFMAIWIPNTFGLHLKNHKLQKETEQELNKAQENLEKQDNNNAKKNQKKASVFELCWWWHDKHD